MQFLDQRYSNPRLNIYRTYIEYKTCSKGYLVQCCIFRDRNYDNFKVKYAVETFSRIMVGITMPGRTTKVDKKRQLFTNFNNYDNYLSNETANKNQQRCIRQDNGGFFL